MTNLEFDDMDEEELEMLINGLIHPGDMFTPPDFMGGAFPQPFGGPGAGMGMPGAGIPGGFGGGLDSMIAQAYDEEEDEL